MTHNYTKEESDKGRGLSHIPPLALDVNDESRGVAHHVVISSAFNQEDLISSRYEGKRSSAKHSTNNQLTQSPIPPLYTVHQPSQSCIPYQSFSMFVWQNA